VIFARYHARESTDRRNHTIIKERTMMTVELSTTEQLVLKRGVSEYKFTGVMSVNFAMGLAGMAFDAKLFSMKDGYQYNRRGTILMFNNKHMQ
jgi:hypothetical protein